jgi:acetyltransferase-like isoleucine patch superfamily enzyme
MGFVYVRGERREIDNTRPVDLVMPEWNITILGTTLGEGVEIWSNLNIYGTILPLVMIPTGVELGNCVFVGPQVVFTNDLSPSACGEDGVREDDFDLVETVVRDHASIGGGSVILAGVTIGRHAVVGAGSVVVDSVGDHEVWYGDKARRRRRPS